MNKSFWQRLIPHVIAIVIFLILAFILCRPALEADTVLKQSDVSSWQGMSHQSFQYKEKHGHFPLWTTNMFSGMPGYQIAIDGPWTPLGIINSIFQLELPKPMNFFFLACLAFYFLCQCLRIRPWVSIIGAIGFAYCSYNASIIVVGHETKMMALAYAPAVLGSIILLFERKYITGFVLTALFTALQLAQNHQQITYYLLIVIGIMTVFYLANSIKNKETIPLFKGIGLAVVAGIIGLMVSAVLLLPVYDLTKQSKRNGQLVMDGKMGKKNDVVANNKTKGLSKDYAFMWSYGTAESLSLMFPGVRGYGSHVAERDGEYDMFPKLDENSNFVKYFTDKLNVPEDQAANIGLQWSRALYWGDQPFTDGPVYVGAVICFLFIFAMIYLNGKNKWWILTASVLGIMMAWGRHFPALNYFLFDYLPLYNKFRAPSMTMVIPQLLFPLAAALALEKLVVTPVEETWKKFRLSLIVTGAVFFIAVMLYFSFDYSVENKKRTAAFSQTFNANDPNVASKMDSINALYEPSKDNQVYENFTYQSKGDPSVARSALSALRKDRKSAFGSDILRSFLYVLVAAVLIFLFLKKKINATVMLAGIGLATAIDLLSFDSRYLNKFSFDSKEKYEVTEFPVTGADQVILKDPDPNYRVLNTTTGLEESHTSYYHKSIGGYHPAKLGIYDDLMAYQLGGSMNPAVINMLNTKYIIQQNTQTNQLMAIPNPFVAGNCWFVKGVRFVKGPVEEMKALNNFNPKDTTIIDESFRKLITNIAPPDSAEYIKQVVFDNDDIKYESSSHANHVAVFSEIYYKDWKAYIDSKPADYFKANYVLRAMVIPPGKHTIEFKFEPKMYYLGRTITIIGTWILTLILLGFILWNLKPLLDKNKAKK